MKETSETEVKQKVPRIVCDQIDLSWNAFLLTQLAPESSRETQLRFVQLPQCVDCCGSHSWGKSHTEGRTAWSSLIGYQSSPTYGGIP